MRGMTIVLLVDGPLAGKFYSCEHGKPIIHEAVRMEGHGLNATFTQVVTRYQVHSLVVFGRLMHFGTEGEDLPHDALNAMFWALMATRAAMEASEAGEIRPAVQDRNGASHDSGSRASDESQHLQCP